MTKIKAVLFDFGGVTVTEGFQNWITEHIAPYSTLRPSMIAMQNKVDLGDMPVSAYNEFLAEKTGMTPQEAEKGVLANYSLHQDVLLAIKKLRKQNIKTAIVSNFPKEWFWKIYRKLHLQEYFDDVLISSELHMIKPHADILLEALKRLQVKPEEAVFFDDTKEYAEQASAIGIHGIQFRSEKEIEKDLLTLRVQV